MKYIRVPRLSRWSQHESLISVCIIRTPAPPSVYQLRAAVRRELCGGEGDQQHDGGTVLQDEEGPGRDVVTVRGRHGHPRLLPALLPGHWVSGTELSRVEWCHVNNDINVLNH